MRITTTDEVKKLNDALPCTPGETIGWAAFEELLAPLTRHDRRFRTIYRAWIRYLRKWQNRKAIVIPGQGIRILRESERTEDVCTTIGKTWRLFDVAKTDVDDIQIVELTTTEVEQAHHVRHITHRLHRAMAQERTSLAAIFPPPAPSPTRRRMPQAVSVA